jgi:hypothetical protein
MEIEKASPEQLLMVAEESQKDEKLQNEVLKLIAIRQEDRATELVADLIKETNYIDSIKQDKGSEIWFYENGVRMPNGEAHIKEICRRIFGEAYTPQRANKVIAKIEADSFYSSRGFF